jgi:hypothetical protein
MFTGVAHGRSRRRRVLPAIFVLACALTGVAWAADSSSLEIPIKATFLVKFGEFIDWPAGATDGDYTICLLGADAMIPALDQASRGQNVRGRPVAPRRVADAAALAGCQVVYLGDAKTAEAALTQLRGKPVLTVTDDRSGPMRSRGIVHFLIQDNRVRFQIDDEAAAINTLSISSKLLSLAVSVHRRKEGMP